MKPKCELCHKNEAKKIIWLDPEESPLQIGGRYQVCEKCEDKHWRIKRK